MPSGLFPGPPPLPPPLSATRPPGHPGRPFRHPGRFCPPLRPPLSATPAASVRHSGRCVPAGRRRWADGPRVTFGPLGLTGGYGADAVLDCVGLQPTVDLATQIIAPDGALRFVGLGGGSFPYAADSLPVPLPWGVDVRRSYGGTRTDQRQVIELAKLGKIAVETRQYALVDGIRAFDDLEAGQVRGRAILVP
ncbi:hypothetical protein GCM10010167_70390 [Paractinoplanes deccanensis]|uniref:zinc-binding dehydrogenase n=1 Tax=Paractinoplanes deccanensis TaxID=113561 RepID=UPI0023B2768C|nr:zinc-binding dehydrogenase [Actinoplanes deccanensis]